MKAKFLSAVFVTVLTLFVIMCCTRTSFSLSLMDKFDNEKDWIPENDFDIFGIEEPFLEDIFRERNPVHLKMPNYIKTTLWENDFVPWKISRFVHLCKKSYNGSQCPMNGLTIFISTIFVKKDTAVSNISRIEILFNPDNGKAYEFIIKDGNRFWTIELKKIKI